MHPTKVRRLVLGMLFLLSIITYLDRVCISVAAPEMSKDLGLTDGQLGLIFGIFTFAYGIFEIPGGWLGDRFGPRLILTRIVVWWSAFTALTGVVSNFVTLLVVRGLFGAGEAGAYPNSSCTIARWFPVHERAGALGLVWTASRLGGALSPLLVVPLQDAFGWRAVFYIFSLFGVFWAVAWWFWFRDHPSQMPSVNQGELDVIGDPGVPHGGVPFRRIASNGNLWIIMLMYHFFCYGSYWYIAWTPTYLAKAKGMSGVTLAGFAALPFLLGALSNAVGGFVGDWTVRRLGLKWGRRLVGMGGVGLAGAFMIVSVAIENQTLAIVVLAMGFAASDFMLPTCWAVCLDVSKGNAGTVTGAMNTAGQMGATLMSGLFGFAVERYGWNLPLIAIGAISLLSAALWLAIDPTKPIQPEVEAVAARKIPEARAA